MCVLILKMDTPNSNYGTSVFCLFRLGEMRVPECKFFDSKMRPLMLAYDNPDPSAVLQDVRIMFKNGDGINTTLTTHTHSHYSHTLSLLTHTLTIHTHSHCSHRSEARYADTADY